MAESIYEVKKFGVGTSDVVTVPIGGGAVAFKVRINGLQRVEKVVQVNILRLDPPTQATPFGYKVGEKLEDANVVGLTIYFAAGTTVQIEVIATGY